MILSALVDPVVLKKHPFSYQKKKRKKKHPFQRHFLLNANAKWPTFFFISFSFPLKLCRILFSFLLIALRSKMLGRPRA